MLPPHWLGLMRGNSRWHWAYFQQATLTTSGDGDFQDLEQTGFLTQGWPLCWATVVPSAAPPLTPFPAPLALKEIPLGNLYPTLGIDRALAGFGAVRVYGVPCLVIDAGTALTLTAWDAKGAFWGGAILPGLGLQLAALHQNTGALPWLTLPPELPAPWGQDTHSSIIGGVVHTLLGGVGAYLRDWRVEFPEGKIILTGGDGPVLKRYFRETQTGELILDPQLIFRGMAALVQEFPERLLS
ncbi:MAG: pantothenate kinase [Cyanobacteria bacterium RI_101]|nr:pantothenate kinase [Cyanobacteria bacterium RI_101]